MLIQLVSRLLTEDPNQRLGARGASEVFLSFYLSFIFFLVPDLQNLLDKLMALQLMMQVKQHPFFKDINWDTLARQKV